MTDRKIMQMALDALEEITGWQSLAPGYVMEEADEAKNSLRDRLAWPEPTGREVQKMIQAAWKAVRTEYKDDPECCFALGWEAGYGAVAPRVEPPETESGEGFESIPAPPPKQYEPEPVCDKIPQECWSIRCQLGRICKNTAPPKREWVGLTDDEIEEAYQLSLAKYIEEVDPDYHSQSSMADYVFVRAIEAKLKEKNNG